jgi:YfiH family protein
VILELALPGGRVAFSTRRGGVSPQPYESLNLGALTDDEGARVRENRRRLAGLAGIDPRRVAMGWQVHGADVLEWERPPEPPAFAEPGGVALPKVDGHATSVPGLALLVLVADCLPVALVTPGRVAMLHCGWRGLAAGLLARALEGFAEPPAAALGPAIGPCCYEVGPDVLERFKPLGGVVSGRRLDLGAVARRQLEAAGVQRIEEVGLCTSCHPELFFSHRRDDGRTGRQGGLAWLEP